MDAPTSTELALDPHPVLARLRRDSPVARVDTAGDGPGAYLVTTWDLVAEAVARVDDFSNRFRHTLYRTDDDRIAVLAFDAGTDVFAGADPPAHTHHRRLFFPELVQRRMAGLEHDVAAIADAHLAPLLAAGGGDAAALLAEPLPLRVVLERVIGIDLEAHDVDAVRGWVFAGARLMGGRLRLDELGNEAERAAGLLPWIGAALDDALGAAAEGDVRAAAAAGVRSGVLTRDEAAFALMVLVGAGAETTTALIGNAIRVLADRPVLQRALRRDPTLVPAFLEEVLRLESPFRFHPRSVPRSTSLGGVTVPAGALVALCWASANRDATVFDRADELVLDRDDGHRHLAFGRGIHHCVGAPLARLEARIVVEKLLAATSAVTLDPAAPPRWTDSLWIRRHDRLPVLVSPA